jgi:hypothetical protein
MEVILSAITIASIFRFTIETCEFMKYEEIRQGWYRRLYNLVRSKPKQKQLTIFHTDEDDWTEINTDWILVDNG